MCVYIYICLSLCLSLSLSVFFYLGRERESESERDRERGWIHGILLKGLLGCKYGVLTITHLIATSSRLEGDSPGSFFLATWNLKGVKAEGSRLPVRPVQDHYGPLGPLKANNCLFWSHWEPLPLGLGSAGV